MSAVRIKLSGEKSVLHCIGRIVAGEMLLDDVAKETLTGMLGKMAAFCGLEVITYCMMSHRITGSAGTRRRWRGTRWRARD